MVLVPLMGNAVALRQVCRGCVPCMLAGLLDSELIAVSKRVSNVLINLPRNITPVNLEELRRVKQALVELESKADNYRCASQQALLDLVMQPQHKVDMQAVCMVATLFCQQYCCCKADVRHASLYTVKDTLKDSSSLRMVLRGAALWLQHWLPLGAAGTCWRS